ncbi:hypothetical protein AZI86_16015 [Bdellovibrio bacteriovorus]|uniref:Uncharacterized protein n=1 Tax=Bdellovibrio bacteriovorus TaxID=959 RepID=A0A150WHY7_BDEBC|nr:hypothetical protein [Bdellovibrio bacteriovorus]KYG63208.1 hypothetical protein AZI86_16015 [Bdellovibrio bacteriovorus]
MKPRLYFFDKPTVLLLIALTVLSVVMVIAGAGFEGLDLKFYYSGDEALRILSALSSEQRQRYLRIESLDFIYLSIYTSLLMWNLRKVGGARLMFLGTLPAIFDVAENLCIMHWLSSPGEHFYLGFLSFLTMAKWSFGFSWTVLFFAKFFLRRVKEKRRIIPN